MEIDEGGETIMIGGPGILEEYQKKLEEQRKELSDKIQALKGLQKDYEILFL